MILLLEKCGIAKGMALDLKDGDEKQLHDAVSYFLPKELCITSGFKFNNYAPLESLFTQAIFNVSQTLTKKQKRCSASRDSGGRQPGERCRGSVEVPDEDDEDQEDPSGKAAGNCGLCCYQSRPEMA